MARCAEGMPSCPVPGLPFGSSALRASGTKRSTCRTPAITGFLRAVITENLPVNSALGHTNKKRSSEK